MMERAAEIRKESGVKRELEEAERQAREEKREKEREKRG